MAYQLTFFCRSDEENGQAAISRLLDELLPAGDLLLTERPGPFVDEVAVCSLATRGPAGDPVADRLTLEVHVGVAWVAESVIAASLGDEQGIWGCDLLATFTLSGDAPDWSLVNRIWTALVRLWSATPWDEMSGFKVAKSMPQIEAVRTSPRIRWGWLLQGASAEAQLIPAGADAPGRLAGSSVGRAGAPR
ncbi:hypothetical protein ACFTWS_39230 [Streptomyces sp. NPDC057027]|uniref:hypothetical protein n=1 Tax=Streptomyces sp. NPDC057027 TaxID=3346004 RepID=UPI0036383C69